MSAQNAAPREHGDSPEVGHITVIGVIADPSDHDVVREFFELFKTPWEFYRADRFYDVVLCAGDRQVDELPNVLLLYAGGRTHFDEQQSTLNQITESHIRLLTYRGYRIPIYGDCILFPAKENSLLADADSQKSVAYRNESGRRVTVRIGYDLFGEIRTLLTAGQPAANANLPTLELHIALLRDLITGCGISLVEIPPVPDGYRFIACLTHDVDHPSLRQHKWDHTVFGFLYRALFGSLGKLLHGRMSSRDLAKNWWAALMLPLVYLGIAKDCWSEFGDCYLELENGIRSTFFVIPFKNTPGKRQDGPAPKFRAVPYGAEDISGTIRRLSSAGCEVGLHGIDAWCDSSRGRAELEQIRHLTGASEIGVRMHWLYHTDQTPVILEKARAAYDSTVGYNETVGYRAGTTQVYKPLAATDLLELPLHVMDTALFYPSYLGLSSRQAKEVLTDIVDNATEFGGCVTVNWHDRSLAPERLWDAPYRDLVQELKRRGAWFATAGEAVSWFRSRRSVEFSSNDTGVDANSTKVRVNRDGSLPGLRMRIYKGRAPVNAGVGVADGYTDCGFDEGFDSRIDCAVNR